MVRNEDMVLAPWGAWTREAQDEEAAWKREEEDGSLRKLLEASDEQSEQEKKVSAALQKVADELRNGISITAVALAYVLQKAPYVFPIVGGRKIEHLQDNIGALEINPSEVQIAYLESQSPFSPGFPISFPGQDPHVTGGESTFFGYTSVVKAHFVKGSQAIPGATLQKWMASFGNITLIRSAPNFRTTFLSRKWLEQIVLVCMYIFKHTVVSG